jgi:hypothetical protein
MAAKPTAFKTEVELCARFISSIGADWTAYAESSGHDILLVRKVDGFQIGIQAKLKLNTDVINQVIEDGNSYSATNAGPDCRAVLVPYGDAGGFSKICAYIGVTIIRVMAAAADDKYVVYRKAFDPDLPSEKNRHWGEHWFEQAPAKRHKLPEYVPDVPAGASAPLQLTDWKIKAIKIAVTLEKHGYVTRHDFKHHGIDYRRWIAPAYGWLVVENGRYIKGRSFPDFKRQHPVVYKQIRADAGKWMLKEEARKPEQLALLA